MIGIAAWIGRFGAPGTRGRAGAAVLLALAALAGCATVALREAPIVDRSRGSDDHAATPATAAAAGAAPAEAPAGGGSGAVAGGGRGAVGGTYVVQRGDTLYSIALAFGRDYREIARWNGLDDPTKLKVGQALRVVPPGDDAAAAAAGTAGGSGAAVASVVAPVAPAAGVEIRPLDQPAAPRLAPPPASSAPGDVAPAAAAAAPAATAAAPAEAGNWLWPAAGKVLAGFDDPRNKGIDIEGREGDPVVAAGDGTIVYSGNSLRGYGNLVIIKHTDDYISAYAHNREILVAQGQSVKRGQRIALLGKSEADSPRLHFEIRRQGKPVDPAKLLPPR